MLVEFETQTGEKTQVTFPVFLSIVFEQTVDFLDEHNKLIGFTFACTVLILEILFKNIGA